MRVVLNTFLLVTLPGFGCSSQAILLRVKVDYNPTEDLACSLPTGSSIKEEWKAELLSREPEFLRIWEAQGPRFLATTEAISDKKFPSQEIIARLTLCNSPSESFPETGRVTINMRFALKSFTPEPGELYVPATRKYHSTPEALEYTAMGSRQVSACGQSIGKMNAISSVEAWPAGMSGCKA